MQRTRRVYIYVAVASIAEGTQHGRTPWARTDSLQATTTTGAHFFFGLPAGLLFDLTAPALRGAGLAALPLAALATFFLRLSASVDMLACLTACDVSMAVPTLLSGNIRLKTCCERAVSCAAPRTSGEAVHHAAHASGEWRAAVAP